MLVVYAFEICCANCMRENLHTRRRPGNFKFIAPSETNCLKSWILRYKKCLYNMDFFRTPFNASFWKWKKHFLVVKQFLSLEHFCFFRKTFKNGSKRDIFTPLIYIMALLYANFGVRISALKWKNIFALFCINLRTHCPIWFGLLPLNKQNSSLF